LKGAYRFTLQAGTMMNITMMNMNSIPNTPFSRGFLQGVHKDTKVFERKGFIERKVREIKHACLVAALKKETKCTINGIFDGPHNMGRTPDCLSNTECYRGMYVSKQEAEQILYNEQSKCITELMEMLRTNLPECDVSFHETKGFTGSIIERLIIIDWS